MKKVFYVTGQDLRLTEPDQTEAKGIICKLTDL